MPDPRSACILLQQEICGQTRPAPAFRAAGHKVLPFTSIGAADWRAQIHDFEREIPADQALIVFASLNVADFIRRECPGLARGLIYRPERLRHDIWSNLVSSHLQLNGDFMILPFGRLSERIELIRRSYGEHVFLRPLSSRKPFPGITSMTQQLAQTQFMLRQIHAVQDDCLVLVDVVHELFQHEYRFWITSEGIAAQAAYCFAPGGVDADIPAPACAPDMVAAAERLFPENPFLETVDTALVADFCRLRSGEVRLVEINAWSTSGFYPGVDFASLAAASLDQISGL